MKRLTLVLVFVLAFLMCEAYADELADLQQKKNQAQLTIIQLNAQNQLLQAQCLEYIEKYAADKAVIAENVEKSRKAIVGIDKQIKLLKTQSAEPKE